MEEAKIWGFWSSLSQNISLWMHKPGFSLWKDNDLSRTCKAICKPNPSHTDSRDSLSWNLRQCWFNKQGSKVKEKANIQKHQQQINQANKQTHEALSLCLGIVPLSSHWIEAPLCYVLCISHILSTECK